MRKDLKAKEVLAMYDVRGIQKYIFRTNKIKEIIGASLIVENIILEGFQSVIEELGLEKTKYLINWEEDDPKAYLTNSEIQMQVMFIGGGNAYVLYRKGEVCETFNRKIAKYMLEHTYSLQLAVSVVEKTDSYSHDYEEINVKLREIKATMPSAKPIGAFPFMAVDTVTGFPIVAKSPYQDRYVCKESLLKLEKCKENKTVDESLLENMISRKGENSFLAIVHIDGNNMGKRIKKIMENKGDYGDAIETMRTISKNLKNSFGEAYDVMENYIDRRSMEINAHAKGKLYRKLIFGGDDITFICNAMIALDAVKVFLKHITEHVMYMDGSKTAGENLCTYGLSACAGIAFINSHFPFGDAYKVAEKCCSSAKKRAKEAEHRAGGVTDGNIGCYLDFQICSHVKTTDLEAHREKNYAYPNGEGSMIYRPYYVSSEANSRTNDLNKRNEKYDFEKIFINNIKYFQGTDISRNKMKDLRNSFSFGMGEVEKEITFLKSRGIQLQGNAETWYDALEMVDLYVVEEGEKYAIRDSIKE